MASRRRPRVLAIYNSKGGVGETTLAVHLAVAAEQAGERLAIADTDEQRSAATWGRAHVGAFVATPTVVAARPAQRARVSIVSLALALVAAFAPATAADVNSKISEAVLPAAIRADFRRQFTVSGPELVGLAASPCYHGWRFRGLGGWVKRVVPLTEADRANGITQTTVYGFRARLMKDNPKADFTEARKFFYANTDLPYLSSYTVRNGRVKIADVHLCF
jgi:hypothetical protein